MMYFPYVNITDHPSGFSGEVGMELVSVLKASLSDLQVLDNDNADNTASPTPPDYPAGKLQRFLHAIAPCLTDTVLELRLVSTPNFRVRPQGTILVTLLLRTAADDPQVIRERLLTGFRQLSSLLKAFFQSSEFAPIFDAKHLEERTAAFKPGSVISIVRRQQQISLDSPIEQTPIIGFGKPVEPARKKAPVIFHRFPFRPATTPWGELFSIMLEQMNPVEIIIRIRQAPTENGYRKEYQQTISTCDRFLDTVSKVQRTLELQAKSIRALTLRQLAQITDTALDVGIFLQSPHRIIDHSLARVLGKSVSMIPDPDNIEKMFTGGFSCRSEPETRQIGRFDYFPENVPYSVEEASAAFRIPEASTEPLPGVKEKQYRTRLAILPDPDRIVRPLLLARNVHQGISQPVQIGLNDRMRHLFLLGQTGTGKSTMMENMILQDIRAGLGLAVIDPHGDLIEGILQKIPKRRHKDVVLFDLLDRDWPISFNILDCNTSAEMDGIIDDLYETMDHLYDMKQTGGPMFESYFRTTLRLLMSDGDRGDYRPTVLDFVLAFQKEDFRDWLKKTVADDQVRDAVKEADSARGEASLVNISPYITSKFNRFVNDTALKRIVGQGEKSRIDFDDIMKSGKIFLVNLGKGRFGSTVSALLANQLVTRFKVAAMRRGDLPMKKRRPFFLYVDEAHTLPPDNFMSLLAEARKYNLGLILSTQYCAQFTKQSTGGDNLLAAILGNVGTIMAFRLGTIDAGILAPFFHPYFSEKDIIGLPNFSGYAKMQVSNEATLPFSFQSLMDITAGSRRFATSIRKLSRKKYNHPVEEVDRKIKEHRMDLFWK